MADSVQTQITKSAFPDEIAPYAQNLMGQASALTDLEYNPYMQYQGDRVAQYSPLQQQSYDAAGQLSGGAPQLQDATAMAGSAGLGALNTGYTYNPYASQSFTQPGMAGNYMSPYMQNVVDIQKREADRQSEIQRNVSQAQSVGQGAYGGSRQAIVEAERQRNLGQQMNDIQMQGSQAAYNQAMQQFNAEQGQTQAAANLNAQQGQFGAGLGLQGLQTALTGANTLGNLGQTQFGQNTQAIGLQNQMGLQQQQQAQNVLNTQYQDYTNAMQYPYQQLGFMSDILRGAPLSNTTQTMFSPPPSTTSQLVGLGTAAYGASKMFGSAQGGSIGYARGGSVGRAAGLADLLISRMG